MLDFAATASVFIIPTDDAKPAAYYNAYVRQQLSFYLSTPAYRIVTQLHGWEGIQQQLNELARQGLWDEMPRLITDDMVDHFSLSGTWAELPGKIQKRYDGLLDRVSCYLPFIPGQNDSAWQTTINGFRS